MKKSRAVQVFRRALAFAAAFVMGLPAVAASEQLVIPPAKLIPYSTQQSDLQLPVGVGGGPTPASFWYPLRLPAGTVINGFEYQHGANPAAQTLAGVFRTKTTPTPRLEGVWGATSAVETVTQYEYITVSGDLLSGASRRIQPGWDYFVFVMCQTAGTRVGVVRIRY